MAKGTGKKRPNQSMFALLGLLSFRPMTGYELRKVSEESIQHFWREGYGQIYPSLRELELQGMVTRKSETNPVAGRPLRQVYALTPDGEEALRTWLALPTKPEVPRNELLLKMFFGRRASSEVNLWQITERRKLHVEELAAYKAIEERLHSTFSEHPDMQYWLITLHYGKRYTEAEIAWCDETLEILRQLAAKDGAGSNEANGRA